jgi:DtxR family transcriptional regulator, Mn-dependent transcriptional regulator
VIGMEWEEVHIEACRWEHVMSDAVERRIVTLLGTPTSCPHGNPIPGLEELGALPAAADSAASAGVDGLLTMEQAARQGSPSAVVRRISEQIQPDADVMRELRQAGVQPGRTVTLSPAERGLLVSSDSGATTVDGLVARHVFVTVA